MDSQPANDNQFVADNLDILEMTKKKKKHSNYDQVANDTISAAHSSVGSALKSRGSSRGSSKRETPESSDRLPNIHKR